MLLLNKYNKIIIIVVNKYNLDFFLNSGIEYK